MLGTYASAALICAASMLVGRAMLSIAGRREWSWLEPAVGFGAIVTVTGLLARVVGHGTTATLGRAAAGRSAPAAIAWRERLPRARARSAPACRSRSRSASSSTIPFLVSGRWGMIGVGFNNDLGLHLAWAEWLRSGFGPEPFAGYPLGPHGLAVAVAAVPGLSLGQAFLGEIFAIGILTGLTALAALRRARRRRGARWPRRWSRSPTSPPPTSPRAPSRRPPRRSSCSPSPSPCATRARAAGRPLVAAAPAAPLPGARRRRLLLLQLRRPRLADRDRRPLGPDPARACAGRWRRGRCWRALWRPRTLLVAARRSPASASSP